MYFYYIDCPPRRLLCCRRETATFIDYRLFFSFIIHHIRGFERKMMYKFEQSPLAKSCLLLANDGGEAVHEL